jgi:hypothetical protein
MKTIRDIVLGAKIIPQSSENNSEKKKKSKTKSEKHKDEAR